MRFLAGLILGLLILPLGLIAYMSTGRIPVGADESPMPFEKILAGGAVHARIAKLAPQRDKAGFTTADLVAGAEAYQKNCAFCHGLPQPSEPMVGDKMFPQAPELFDAEGMVTDDPVGVSYWKVQNGIRLSGMPSFQKLLSDQQIWDVAALVARADQLPPEALAALKPPTRAPATSALIAPPTGRPAK
jgi:thiosulfate dehydrogenase